MTTKTCPECGTAVEGAKTFCSAPCRKAWNNRRMTRGAVLYDAFLALRYDRGWAKTVGLWQLICRLVSEWKDIDEKAGRETFARPEKWVDENRAWLRSKNLGVIKIGRNARAS